MCIAVPGKIESIEGRVAVVSFSGNTVRVDVSLVNANIGDYVLVHAGCAIEVMNRDAAQDLLSLLGEIEEAANGH